MFLILIPLSFLLIALLLSGKENKPVTRLLIESMLAFSALVAAGTEVLSLFNAYTYKGILTFWSVVSASLLLSVLLQKKQQYLLPLYQQLSEKTKNNKLLAGTLLVLFAVLFIQGVAYPPNNYDSMAYHMSRIAHWYSHGNVSYYPTNIYRQIFQPPFSEWLIGHICILNRSDVFANAVQLFYLGGILLCVVEICRELKLSRTVAVFAMLFIMATPEVLLEATSTQNDVVVSFFVMLCAYYAIRSIRENSFSAALLMALSAGLSTLTKGTGYVFCFPILMTWFLFWATRVVRSGEYRPAWKYAVVPMLFIAVNSTYYYRNINLSNHLFGDYKEGHFIENPGALTLLSSIVRNCAMHFGVFPANEIVEKAVIAMHETLGLDVNDPRSSWINYGTSDVTKFELTKWMHHEDDAANIFQFLLITLAGFAAAFRVSKDSRHWFWFLMLAGFIMFCAMLKWQPWNSKLHTTYFILFAVPTAHALSSLAANRLFQLSGLVAGFYALLVVCFNPNRPFIFAPAYTGHTKITEERFKKYFATHVGYYQDVQTIKGLLGAYRNETIGFDAAERHEYWEYPFYSDIFSQKAPTTFRHIKVENPSRNAKVVEATFPLEHIISYSGDAEILHGGILFLKKTDNEFINLYSPAAGADSTGVAE
ncbi:MAG: hypothetical protein RI973_2202 [Bacteroidota bacterium]|jgi:hypothetical protein